MNKITYDLQSRIYLQNIIPPPRRQTRPRTRKDLIPEIIETTPSLIILPTLPLQTRPVLPTHILIIVRDRRRGWNRHSLPLRICLGSRRGGGDGASALRRCRGVRTYGGGGGEEEGLPVRAESETAGVVGLGLGFEVEGAELVFGVGV